MPEEWGVFESLFNVEESTFSFLEDVMSEVMTVFPSEYIHVGGDEAVKPQWEKSARVKARMKEFGVKDAHALQSYFIQRMGKYLDKNGRRLIGWDEILEGGLAPNATVMSWRGIDGAIAAAKAGHDTVLSPAPDLYLDHWQSAGDLAPGRSDTLSLEMVYNFQPIPASIPEEQRKHILGLQANLWTEMMRTEERVTYMTFPRIAALAEVAWSPAARIDWPDFQRRLEPQLKRYDKQGIRYAREVKLNPEPHRRLSHDLEQCGSGYVLSLEDDAPLEGERAVFLVNISNPCWIWRGANLAPGLHCVRRLARSLSISRSARTRTVSHCRNRPPETASSKCGSAAATVLRLLSRRSRQQCRTRGSPRCRRFHSRARLAPRIFVSGSRAARSIPSGSSAASNSSGTDA